jgi:hypothetical protein
MEFTMRTVIIMILLLVMALVCATILFGWSADANSIFRLVLSPFKDLVT